MVRRPSLNLGLLLATDEGVLLLEPGEKPRTLLEAPSVVSLAARPGVVLAASAQGAWVYRNRRWDRTWEGDARAASATPDGTLYIGAAPPRLLRSEDDGETWQEFENLRNILAYQRQRGGPGGSSVLGAAAAGSSVVAAVEEAGAFMTLDRGTTWTAHSQGLDRAIHGLWGHPEREHRLYAAAASGFYRSEDGGYTWVQSLAGLDRSWAHGVALLPGTPDTLLLSIARGEGGPAALFRSDNGGVIWRRGALGDEDEWERPPLLASLGDGMDTFFAVANGLAWGSHDRGRTWLPLAEDVPPANALVAAMGTW